MRLPTYAALCVVPVLYTVLCAWLRGAATPFWVWYLQEPNYYYLLDALHLAILEPPGHPYHPGTTVQLVGAAVLRALHPMLSAPELIDTVLAAPEHYLHRIASGLAVVDALALFAAGVMVCRTRLGLLPAIVLQGAPLASMTVLSHAYQAKPEALLVGVVAMLSALMLRVVVAAEGTSSWRRPVAFGVVAGVGLATKLTAAPVFLMPLFVLGGWRGVLVYAGTALAAFLVCFAPALPEAGKFIDVVTGTLLHSGAYLQGERTVIDPGNYVLAALLLFTRPPVLATIALASAGLLLARRLPAEGSGTEQRVLAGLLLAVVAQVLIVAKQLSYIYMIPAYLLLPLALVMGALPLGRALKERRTGVARAAAWGVVLLFATLQGGRAMELAGDLGVRTHRATGADPAGPAGCARIEFYGASSPAYALAHANWWTGMRRTEAIVPHLPARALWVEFSLEASPVARPRDVVGAFADVAALVAESPCAVVRGKVRPEEMLGLLAREVPSVPFHSACSTEDETILVHRVDCHGQVKRSQR